MPKIRIGNSRVTESRETVDGMMIRRRRETPEGLRFTTYERIERPTITVNKRSGDKEIFDHDKLSGAINKSVGKFFDSELEVENVVSRVEDIIFGLGKDEIDSRVIGDAVLDVLAEVNEVAFVRFASVFREFRSLDEFEKIIKEQKSRRKKK